MCLGALVDAGADLKALKALPEALGLKGVRVTKTTVKRAGIKAAKVGVEIDEGAQRPRKLRDVELIINKASIPSKVKSRSIAIFRRIFKAEAKVHGGKAAEVHLHEMGAADTLIDIVGTVLCLNSLGIQRILSSAVSVGSGTIKCAHGVLPVPPPAVAELLKGVKVVTGFEGMELTTPTGAAIIRELAESFGPMPEIELDAVGAGVGTRIIKDRYNALRVFVGKAG
jgi:hypothetical protein